MTQSVVRYDYGYGIVGESRKHSARRSKAVLLNSTDATHNVVGRAVTYNADNKTVGAGGTGVFAGLISNPKQYAQRGTAAGGPLAPTMTLPNNTIIEAVESDYAFVAVVTNNNAKVGDYVVFLQADGTLQTVNQGAALPAGTTQIHGAMVDDVPGNTAGLCSISLTGPLPLGPANV